MLLRTYKGLIRFILLLISFQFFSLALSPGDDAEGWQVKHPSFKSEHSKSFSLSVFFEENRSEKEGESEDENERLLHCFEIADLSFVSFILTETHSTHTPVLSNGQRYDLKPPLFKLYRIFII